MKRRPTRPTSYFRHVGIILVIRDLWTRIQFEILKELTTVESAADKTAAEPAARERIRVLAEAFCNDMNKASTGELTEWLVGIPIAPAGDVIFPVRQRR
jgi:hypothetical protein